jgi:hypothetical protein
MKKKLISKILIFTLLLNTALPVFAEDTTPKAYDEDEFPQTLKDLRRFEIITLGSLPFVTLDATLAYSTYRYAAHGFDSAYQPDIFSSSSFTQEEQTGIILTSIGISVGIGLTDLIVQLIKRSPKRKKTQINYDDIAVIPISEDPDAVELPLPGKNETESLETEVQEIEE